MRRRTREGTSAPAAWRTQRAISREVASGLAPLAAVLVGCAAPGRGTCKGAKVRAGSGGTLVDVV
jgi:hypothetical protein